MVLLIKVLGIRISAKDKVNIELRMVVSLLASGLTIKNTDKVLWF